jgi:acetyl esterase
MNTAPRSDGGGAFADSAEPQPHRQVLAYLARSLPSPDPWSVDIETLRRDARARVLDVRGELEPVSSVEAIDVRGVASRLYRPRGDEDEVLIWAHGGGWMHGDLDGFADVAVGGDSSGGNLSAAVALKARDCGLDLRAQLLVYPVLDSIEDTDFKIRFRERYATFAGQEGFGTTTFERLKHIWDSYVPDTGRRMSPYLSPLHAPSLRGVAPVILITAEHDFLRGEAEDYARRLSNEGVPAQLHNYRGQIHGFFEMRGVLADADDAIDTAAEALRRSFPDRSAK